MPVTGNKRRAAERLISCLKEHPLMEGEAGLIDAALPCAELLYLGLDDVLIEQGRQDTDLYLLFSGAVEVIVDGEVVARRREGEVVGEVEVIAPELRRIATIQVCETALVGRIGERAVAELGNEYPGLWRSLGRIAVGRLGGRAAETEAGMRGRNPGTPGRNWLSRGGGIC